jgi:hypothetical protein
LFALGFGATAQNRPFVTVTPATKYVKFYPNPAIDNITFEIENFDRSYTLQIFNFIGKKLADIKPGNPSINVPLTDFYRGIYIFQLRDRSGRILDSGKFQVVR